MKLTTNLKDNSYDVNIKKDSIKNADKYFDLNRKVLIVTDDNVPEKYSKAVKNVSKEGFIVTVKNGEEHKDFETVKIILQKLLENNFSRNDCVVAVGGGVVGDISGFAASLYMRGIDFYNIPTTVLSQVDSSIGGKTAVNFGGIKNSIGTFYQPKGVLIDTDTLSTLAERHIKNGLIEAVKCGAIKDKELFDTFLKNGYDDIENITFKSLSVKKEIVEKDEKENGERRLLNFGHTLGHGIEITSEGKLLHGEAVALGMYLISDKDTKNKLETIYKNLGIYDYVFSVYREMISTKKDEILSAVMHDKKMVNDLCVCIFANSTGHGKTEKIPKEKLAEFLC